MRSPAFTLPLLLLACGADPAARPALAGADLRGRVLQGAHLDGRNMVGVDLEGARLHGASLERTRLAGARLEGADLTGADLMGADLTGANLRGANLARADLTGADLSGADLTGARLGALSCSSDTTLHLTPWGPCPAGETRSMPCPSPTTCESTMARLEGVRWAGATCPDGEPALASGCHRPPIVLGLTGGALIGGVLGPIRTR